MAIMIIYALIGAATGAAACYVAHADQRALYFLAGLLGWPIIALALVAEFVDERRPRPEKLPQARASWPRTRRAQ